MSWSRDPQADTARPAAPPWRLSQGRKCRRVPSHDCGDAGRRPGRRAMVAGDGLAAADEGEQAASVRACLHGPPGSSGPLTGSPSRMLGHSMRRCGHRHGGGRLRGSRPACDLARSAPLCAGCPFPGQHRSAVVSIVAAGPALRKASGPRFTPNPACGRTDAQHSQASGLRTASESRRHPARPSSRACAATSGRSRQGCNW